MCAISSTVLLLSGNDRQSLILSDRYKNALKDTFSVNKTSVTGSHKVLFLSRVEVCG